jgi:ferredoxin/flavodoxin---NADP+ reductase
VEVTGSACLPGDFAGARAAVGDPGQHEEQVGKPIHVDHHQGWQLDLAGDGDDATLGASTDRTGDMQRGRFWCPAGKDERAQRLELLLAGIDLPFELSDALLVDAGLLELLPHAGVIGRGQQRANGEQITLDRCQHVIDTRHELDRAGQAERGIALVDITVGFDPRMVLLHAAATEQRRLSLVTRAGVDLERHPQKVTIDVSSGMTTHEIRDITIIGAGPTGLFAQFYAGMRGATAQLLDALPEPGGQLTALYPEKFIFDVAGFPRVLAKDLVRNLRDQAAQFGQPVHLLQRVVGLERVDGHFELITDTDRFPTRAIVIAGGIGAFRPRRLPQSFAEPWYGRGIDDIVTEPEKYRDRRVIIIGGGDSAFDWAAQLRGRAAHVTLVHRSDRFRAHGATVQEVEAAAANGGNVAMHTFHELDAIHERDGVLCGVRLRETKTKATRDIDADVLLPMLGYVSDLGVLGEWGLDVQNDEIRVNSCMETGQAGIYAAGDITTYAGKLKLIATGFGEAAIAVNQAVHWIYPEKKVNPGHSSNLAIFGQSE